MTGEHDGAAPKFMELESLRGLAALLVVLFHCPRWVPAIYDNQFVRNGNYAVTFFFVLSGFVICNAYADRLHTAKDVLRFQLLRLGRLYPLHLTFLLGIVLYETARVAVGLDPLSPNFDLSHFWQHLFLLQAWSGEGALAFNGPAWSISVELAAYLLFALVVLVASRWKGWAFGAIVAFALLAMVLPLPIPAVLRHGFLGFFIGALTALLAQRLPERSMPAWVAPVALAGLVALLSVPRPGQWYIAVICPVAAILVLALARGRNSWFSTALRAGPLTLLGAWSYSIYLSHVLVLHLFAHAVARFGYPVLPTWLGLATYAMLLAAVLLVSWASYSIIERPCRNWSRAMVFRRMGR